MEDKYEDLIKKYDMQICTKKRTRNGMLFRTEDGYRLLTTYRGTLSRLLFAEEVKKQLKQQGYSYVDCVLPDTDGNLIVSDVLGEHWCLKEWYLGEECNLRDGRQIKRAAVHLAKLHNKMTVPEGLEKYYYSNISLPEQLEKHNRELKHVRSYMRSKRRKNEMEMQLLNAYPSFYEQAGYAMGHLRKEDWEILWEQTKQRRLVRHGAYTYHNILFQGTRVITNHFEKAEIGLQVRDLYDLLRKVMEKNNWSKEQGIRLLDVYQKIRPLSRQEQQILYILLCYPEKYWKIVNFYFNNKKSWMSCKNLEKLQKLIAQEGMRENFLKEISRYFDF